MSTDSNSHSAGPASTGAVAAASVLALLGLAIVAPAVWLAATGIGHGLGSGGLFEAMLAGAVLLALIGLLHIRTAALIWAGSDGGRQIGLGLGVIGVIVGGLIALWVLEGTDLTPVLLPVPYLIVVIGLLVSRRHFAGRPGAGAADYSSSSRS